MRITDEEKQRIISAERKDGALFNLEALQAEFAPVFIVRDINTALYMASVGYEAIGLEDPANVEDLKNAIKQHRPGSAVISLPWADKFIDAADQIATRLKELKIPHVVTDAESGSCIDFDNVERAEGIAEAALEELNGAFYRENNVAARVTDFLEEIQSANRYPALKTGFDFFDEIIGGGLYPGLYAIAGEPGAGKTSFVLQIADNIAKTGKDVFLYAAEMSFHELYAKSVSRLTFEKSRNPGAELRRRAKAAGISCEDLAKTTHDVLDGTRHAGFTDLEKDVISGCVFEHADCKGLYVIECFDGTTAEDIRKAVAEWKAKTGSAPVVIVDYLQILAPINDRGTDKQNADAAVRIFKGIARTYKTPVLCISSLNRSSYDEDNENGFKESGSIEYTADITMRLTLPDVFDAGKDEATKDKKAQLKKDKKREVMQQNPRRVDALIMKSRFETPFQTASFEFYAKYNCFIPVQDAAGFRDMTQKEEATAKIIFGKKKTGN